MNQYVTAAVIKEFREKKHLTQAELADKLHVSDKTVSKWETGRGYPDISLLEAIASVFEISTAELLSGNAVTNMNTVSNMFKSKFYVCPVCGNVVHSMGELSLCCHGIQLKPEQAEYQDKQHEIVVEQVEDEYFVTIKHDMTKEHYISFIAALSPDGLQLIKLYPEGPAEARIKMRAVRRIYCFCNRDRLYYTDVRKS